MRKEFKVFLENSSGKPFCISEVIADDEFAAPETAIDWARNAFSCDPEEIWAHVRTEFVQDAWC